MIVIILVTPDRRASCRCDVKYTITTDRNKLIDIIEMDRDLVIKTHVLLKEHDAGIRYTDQARNGHEIKVIINRSALSMTRL